MSGCARHGMRRRHYKCPTTHSRSLRAVRTRKIVQRQHNQGGGKHERKSLLRSSSRGSKIRRGLWLRPCYRDILHCQPLDTLGNHPRHFGLAVCDLLRTVSVIEQRTPRIGRVLCLLRRQPRMRTHLVGLEIASSRPDRAEDCLPNQTGPASKAQTLYFVAARPREQRPAEV